VNREVRRSSALGIVILSLGLWTVGGLGSGSFTPAVLEGSVMSDEELLEVEGEGAVITILAGAVVGAAGSAGAAALVDWADGNGISGRNVGISAMTGAVTGGAGAALHVTTLATRAVTVAGSSIVAAARCSSRTAASLGAAAHVFLHHSVRMPVQRAFVSAWRWLAGS
jgi:hypothetical protein